MATEVVSVPPVDEDAPRSMSELISLTLKPTCVQFTRKYCSLLTEAPTESLTVGDVSRAMLACPDVSDPDAKERAAALVACEDRYDGVLVAEWLLDAMPDEIRERAELYNLTAPPEDTQRMLTGESL